MVSFVAGLTVLMQYPQTQGLLICLVIYSKNHFVIIKYLNIFKAFIVLHKYLLEYLFYLFVVYNFVKSSQESYVTLCNVYLDCYI